VVKIAKYCDCPSGPPDLDPANVELCGAGPPTPKWCLGTNIYCAVCRNQVKGLEPVAAKCFECGHRWEGTW